MAGLAWERLAEPKPQLALEIRSPGGQVQICYLGPHAPRLTPAEIDILHSIWLELSGEVAPEELHHHDVIHFALEQVRKGISEGRRKEVIDELRRHLRDIQGRHNTHP